ncbi:MAG TPA: HAMP domain-containing sensor histidine kinase [Cyclobacteriaceae bacterium]
MSSYWLFIFLSALASVLIALFITYQRLQKHKKLIRIQSLEIEKQLRELVHQNEIQQKLNQEKQQVIGAVSHDLKGPFNRIFALVQLMDMSGGLTDEQKEYVGKIHQISVDGLGMVRNLLDNRKLEDTGIEMLKEEINLSILLHVLVKHYRSVAEKKNIQMNFEAPKESKVISDRNYLNRIFENLLSNAIKFSNPSTKILISIGEQENYWFIKIKDEGPGVSAEDQQKMFNKFQKLSPKPTGGESSTGLGLWIVKTLLEKTGGTIECESKEGEGSVFEVRLTKA